MEGGGNNVSSNTLKDLQVSISIEEDMSVVNSRFERSGMAATTTAATLQPTKRIIPPRRCLNLA
jgi:hypothetical protein